MASEATERTPGSAPVLTPGAGATEGVHGAGASHAIPGAGAEPAAPARAAAAAPADRPHGGLPRSRFVLLYVAPLMLALAAVALPLARGTETLFLRDVMNTHLEMKWAQAEALRHGYFPLLDPYRAGGQPLAGNPNAVPFYPTNLLYLSASPFWALNAHFWLHLLLAPFAFAWMARRWGLGREAAWAGAACYTLSGFYLSHLSFYNLIAGVTLAPALVAACLAFAAGRRRLMAPLIALLWGLLLVGGDPLMAVLALLLAGGSLLAVYPRSWRQPIPRATVGASAWLAACLACGTLLAIPQIIEFLRILPVSFRGHWGYTPKIATVASFDPRQVAEWVVPLLFGRLDVLGPGSFWGSPYYTDTPPYYPSLYPGLLAFGLVAASGWPSPARRKAGGWAWAMAAGGLFCSLGRFNPLVEWVFTRSSKGALRYPVKFWLPLAVGAALLCGLGFERLIAPGTEAEARAARRRLLATLGILALLLALLFLFLNLMPGAALSRMRQIIPRSFTGLFVARERVRWSGLCLLSLVLTAALASVAGLLGTGTGREGRSRPDAASAALAAGALLLAVHAVAQTWFLRPLYPSDAVAPYRVPPPALAYVPQGATVVNASFNSLFGPARLSLGRFPAPRSSWLERRAAFELYPFTGPQWQRRYELNEGPEGLDTFLSRMAEGSVKPASNQARFQMLAAWGVGRVLSDHALTPLASHARLLATIPSFGESLFIYEVTDRAAPVFLARRALPAPYLNAALTWLTDPGFQPQSDVVVPGTGPPHPLGGGTVRLLRRGTESLEAEVVVGAGGSILVVQRANLLFRATVDGVPAPVVAANLHRVGVALPEGRHRVRLWVDRANLRRSLYAAALAALALPFLALPGRGAGRRRAALRTNPRDSGTR